MWLRSSTIFAGTGLIVLNEATLMQVLPVLVVLYVVLDAYWQFPGIQGLNVLIEDLFRYPIESPPKPWLYCGVKWCGSEDDDVARYLCGCGDAVHHEYGHVHAIFRLLAG